VALTSGGGPAGDGAAVEVPAQPETGRGPRQKPWPATGVTIGSRLRARSRSGCGLRVGDLRVIAKAGKNVANLRTRNTVARRSADRPAPVSGGKHEASAKFFTRCRGAGGQENYREIGTPLGIRAVAGGPEVPASSTVPWALAPDRSAARAVATIAGPKTLYGVAPAPGPCPRPTGTCGGDRGAPARHHWPGDGAGLIGCPGAVRLRPQC